MSSLEQQKFDEISHWKPEHSILKAEELLSPEDKYFKLFSHLYELTKKQCSIGPQRKNGENCFIHPLNVVLNLKRAEVKDGLTLCIGIMHDYVEDNVDEFQQKKSIKAVSNGIRTLRLYEQKMYKELYDKIKIFTTNEDCEIIVQAVKLLTRSKREFYYKSIANLFNEEDHYLKKRAIQVKLADRMHNILCIESFNEQHRIYECFKNLFILNNTKKFLIDRYGKNVLSDPKINSKTVKLFKKCSKATYDAFLTICQMQINKKVGEIRSLLQLAFRKFALEKAGMWAVTKFNPDELHPMRLFQGVIRKYDARLLHNNNVCEERTLNEARYCKKFFAAFDFNDDDIQSIIDYKDAYALKEVIAKLMYDGGYFLKGFLTSNLSRAGKIKA